MTMRNYHTFVLDWHSLKKAFISALSHLLHRGPGNLFLAFPTAFPNPQFLYLRGCLMLFCPRFQGAKPAHDYFQPCPKSFHGPEIIIENVQGPYTAL